MLKMEAKQDDPTWRRVFFGRLRGWPGAVIFVVLVLVMGLIGWSASALIDKAYGAPVDDSSRIHPALPRPDQVKRAPAPPPAVLASNFNRGDYGSVDYLPTGKWFADPAVAKEVFVDKLTRHVAAKCHDANSPPVCDPPGNKGTVGKRIVCDRCVAYDIYREMVAKANCSGKELTYSDHLCRAKYPGEGPQLTKHQLQVGGSVVLCGAVAGLAARFGGGLITGIVGGAYCAWQFWRDVDGGGSWRVAAR